MDRKVIDYWNKAIYGMLIILVLAIPLAFDCYLDDTFDLPKVTLLRLGAVLLLGIWLTKIYFQRKISWRYSPLHLPIMAFLLVSGIATLNSIHRYTSLMGNYRFYFGGFFTLLCGIIIYFIISQELEEKVGERIVSFILSVGAIVAFYGVCQYYGVEFFKRIPLVEKGRVWSTMGNAIYLGGFLVMVIPLAMSRFQESKGIKRGLLGALILLLEACLLVTLSRSAWVGIFFAIIFWVFMIGPKEILKERKAWGAIFFAAAILLTVFMVPKRMGYSRVAARAVSIVNTKESGNRSRIENWKSALKMIEERPILGSGPGTFGLLFPHYKTREFALAIGGGMTAENAHNEFLQIGSTRGLLGLGIYLWLLLAIFYVGLRLIRQRRKRTYLAGALAGLLALLIQNQFNFAPMAVFVYFWIFSGMVAAEQGKKVSPRELRIPNFIRVAIFGTILMILILIRLALLPYWADRHYKNGLAYAQGKRWDKAIAEYKIANALNGHNTEYHRHLGNAYKKQAFLSKNIQKKRELLKKTIAEFQKNIQLDPYRPYHYNNLGIGYMWLAQFAGEPTVGTAQEQFVKTLEIDPLFLDAMNNLAKAYGYEGREKEAIVLWEKALEIDPSFEKAKKHLERVKGKKGEDNENR